MTIKYFDHPHLLYHPLWPPLLLPLVPFCFPNNPPSREALIAMNLSCVRKKTTPQALLKNWGKALFSESPGTLQAVSGYHKPGNTALPAAGSSD